MNENLFSRLRAGHTFHIPVMGTGFTIDTSLKVARYGISSVLSLVDDVLIEKMRRLHCHCVGESCEEIKNSDEDSRARRITSYLNMLDNHVREQVSQLRESVFEKGSEITRYFEMLPESPLKLDYRRMLQASNPGLKQGLQDALRKAVTAGRIDVNIMTKLDRDRFCKGVKLPAEFSDALAALRGFALSKVNASVVLSAGMNRRLFSYISRFEGFFPDETGDIHKQIVLKVSDFRSAFVQGRMLARLGLWVSEFRVESGLNCGGHAFATQGYLIGPILEEFRSKRLSLSEQLYQSWRGAMDKAGRTVGDECPEQRITAQGGIGTHEEQDLLMQHYGVDGTGWGTPFLLVPEAVNVDVNHRQKLANASADDVCLSDASPLGVPFWNLKTSTSEEARRKRIEDDSPGSACPKGYLAFDTEVCGRPVCPASRAYQQKMLERLAAGDQPPETLAACRESVLAKSCICNDLSGSVPREDGKTDVATAVCCGPNIVNFDRSLSLDEMIGHIYGQTSVLHGGVRPHMFISELSLYVDFLRRELEQRKVGLGGAIKSLKVYRDNLLDGVEYYRTIARDGLIEGRENFLESLADLAGEIDILVPATDTPE